MTSFRHHAVAALALAAAGLTSGHAFARPASVVGTYLLRLDNDQLKLVIFSQVNTGTCKRIVGSLSQYDGGASIGAMVGWYCPSTGRIGYQVLKPSDGSTMQSFSGVVSVSGSIFAGSLSMFGSGLRGEYNLVGGPL